MAAPLITSDPIASKRYLRWRTVALLIALALVACSMFYCFGIPVITGQACVDFVSGHVPAQAEDIFLRQVLAKWGTDYEVIGGDDLGGQYDRTVRLGNGKTLRVSYYSVWPSCPDFVVTEDEVFQNIKSWSVTEVGNK